MDCPHAPRRFWFTANTAEPIRWACLGCGHSGSARTMAEFDRQAPDAATLRLWAGELRRAS
jgi:hypothetical protein